MNVHDIVHSLWTSAANISGRCNFSLDRDLLNIPHGVINGICPSFHFAFGNHLDRGLLDQDHHCIAVLSHRHGGCPRKFLVAAVAAPVPPLLVPTLESRGGRSGTAHTGKQ